MNTDELPAATPVQNRVASLLEGFFRSTDAIRALPRMIAFERNDPPSRPDLEAPGEQAEADDAREPDLDSFKRQLINDLCLGQGLRDPSNSMLTMVDKDTFEEISRLVETECEYKPCEGRFLVRGKTPQADRLVRQAHQSRKTFQEMARLVDRSLLLSVTSVAEIFMASLLRTHYMEHPGAAGKAVISIEDLKQFESIDQAIAQAIDGSIESILRKNVSEWLEEVCKALSVKLDPVRKYVPEFEEAFMRRNLLVHNNGVVGRQYMMRCTDLALQYGVDIGDTLEVSADYLQRCLDIVIGLLAYVGYVYLARIERRSDSVLRSELLNEYCLRLLDMERYDLVRALCRMAHNDETASDRDRLVAKVNECQAMKWMGLEEDCRAEVNKIDWSTRDELFHLVRAALLDDYEVVKRIAKDRLAAKQLKIDWLLFWPIFKKCRVEGVFDDLLPAPDIETEDTA